MSTEQCRLCRRAGRKCIFHAARTPGEFVDAVINSFRRDSIRGLANMVEAANATLSKDLPPEMREAINALDDQELQDEFNRLLQRREWQAKHLRRFAALSLTLAIVAECDEEFEDDGDEEEEDERRSVHHR